MTRQNYHPSHDSLSAQKTSSFCTLTVLGFLVFFGFGAASTTHAAACAKAELKGGPDCASLRVTADLKNCDETPTLQTMTVHCESEERASATLATAQHTYRIKLRKKSDEGAWGGSPEWRLSGSVKQISARTAAAEPVSSAEASRSVATASGAPALTFKGLIDFYYINNLNGPLPVSPLSATSVNSATLPVGNNGLRYYDSYHNQMGLNLAELAVKGQASDVAFAVDLDFGQTADLNAAMASQNGFVVDEVTKHLGQAVVTYTPSSVPGLTIDAGKMLTHVGLELYKAKDNWQYSRSTLFSYGGPFWHTGLHVGYLIAPAQVTLGLYVYNGWNSLSDNNSAKTLGAQLKWTPSDKLTLIYNTIAGAEQEKNNGNLKMVHEFNYTWTIHSAWTLAGDLLTGYEKGASVSGSSVDAEWRGASLAIRYQPVSWTSFSPRGEIYRDCHGYTLGKAQTLTSLTLTQAFYLTDHLETRVEFRHDSSSNNEVFQKRGGATVGTQSSILIGFMASI